MRPRWTNRGLRLSLARLRLAGFKLKVRGQPNFPVLDPFAAWGAASFAPLPWYSAYNKAKHDREREFQRATLENPTGGCERRELNPQRCVRRDIVRMARKTSATPSASSFISSAQARRVPTISVSRAASSTGAPRAAFAWAARC
jgi:hypothetical protein